MGALTSLLMMPDEPNWRNFDSIPWEKGRHIFSPLSLLVGPQTFFPLPGEPLTVPLGPTNPHRGPLPPGGAPGDLMMS